MERFGDRIIPGGVGLQPKGCRNDLSDRQPLFNNEGGGPVHPADDDLMRHDISGDRSSRGPPGMWQPDRCAARSLHSPRIRCFEQLAARVPNPIPRDGRPVQLDLSARPTWDENQQAEGDDGQARLPETLKAGTLQSVAGCD